MAGRPRPLNWNDRGLHAAWIGHSTVLLKIDGFTVLTDPVFGRRCGIRVGPVTVGIKRISAPALHMRWYAARGEGAFVNERAIRVSAVSELGDAQMCYSDLPSWTEFRTTAHPMVDLLHAVWRTRGVGDFLQHMFVAEGAADIAVEPIVNLWDLAAIQVIVEEAGGRFTSLEGERTASGGSALSTNGVLHDEVLAALAEARPR